MILLDLYAGVAVNDDAKTKYLITTRNNKTLLKMKKNKPKKFIDPNPSFRNKSKRERNQKIQQRIEKSNDDNIKSDSE